jgi:hypothetical protein
MWMRPDALTVRLPVTSRISCPFPAAGVVDQVLSLKVLLYGLLVRTPFVTVIEPKLFPYVACVHSSFKRSSAFVPLITSDEMVRLLAAVRLTVAFAPTVKVLTLEVRLISKSENPTTERLFEASINFACGNLIRPLPPCTPHGEVPPATEIVPPALL